MTYRWDSDFVRPYGWIKPMTSNTDKAPSSLRPFNLNYPQGNGKSANKNCYEPKIPNRGRFLMLHLPILDICVLTKFQDSGTRMFPSTQNLHKKVREHSLLVFYLIPYLS